MYIVFLKQMPTKYTANVCFSGFFFLNSITNIPVVYMHQSLNLVPIVYVLVHWSPNPKVIVIFPRDSIVTTEICLFIFCKKKKKKTALMLFAEKSAHICVDWYITRWWDNCHIIQYYRTNLLLLANNSYPSNQNKSH